MRPLSSEQPEPPAAARTDGVAAAVELERIRRSGPLVFGAVVLGVIGYVILSAQPVDRPIALYVGAAAVLMALGAEFVLPWQRLPSWLRLGGVLLCIVGVGLIHLALPIMTTGLLWAYPAMWLALFPIWAALLGMVAMFVGIAVVSLELGQSGDVASPDWPVLPIVLVMLAAMSRFIQLRFAAAQRAQAEHAQLMAARDVAEQLSAVRARNELVRAVSHDVRTPLTSVIGYIDLALDEPDLPPRVRDHLIIAERNAGYVLQLSTQILEPFAEVGTQLELDRVTANLADVVRESLEGQQIQATQRGISFELSGLREVSVSVDLLRIRQVIDNLLSNAIKYNREGGRVQIEAFECADSVVLRVSDTGVGLSPEEVPHVFERHYRSEGARASTVLGNGLGLPISRDIVRQHGGELEVSSAFGVGTTATMTLPMRGVSSAGRGGFG